MKTQLRDVHVLIKTLHNAGVLQTHEEQSLVKVMKQLNHAQQVRDFKRVNKAIAKLTSILVTVCQH